MCVVRRTAYTIGFMMSRTRVTSGTSTSNDLPSRCSPLSSVNSRSTTFCGSQYMCSACSRSWRRTSASLTTPTGRPASLITGAALIRRSVRKTTASCTVSSSRMDTGFDVMTSSAITAWRRSGAMSGIGVVADTGASATEGLEIVVPPEYRLVEGATRSVGDNAQCHLRTGLKGLPLHNSRPRVLIVYNQPVLAVGHPDAAQETDVLETVAEVQKALLPDAFEVAQFGYARDPRLLIDRLADWRPDVVFNLFEGEADRSATEFYHASILEWARVPFTGSPAAALAFARDKVRTKYLLRGAGLLTAPFLVVDEPRHLDWPYAWPAFVKPACLDASVGIAQRSVVTTPDELAARVRHVFDRYGGPVLVEQYIPGREFHVHVIEGPGSRVQVMPLAEIQFQAGPGYWPVYTYEGKWNESSVEFRNTQLVGSVTLDGEISDRVAEVCAAAYRLLGTRDYARVDLRLTPAGEPYVLEVNPNPYLNSLILVEGLKAFGRQFPEFVQGLVWNALDRN